MANLDDDGFKEQTRQYMIKMLAATGMREGYEAPRGSPEGLARTTAAIALAMYGEWLINSAPGKQAEKDRLLADARKLARALCMELSNSTKVKAG